MKDTTSCDACGCVIEAPFAVRIIGTFAMTVVCSQRCFDEVFSEKRGVSDWADVDEHKCEHSGCKQRAMFEVRGAMLNTRRWYCSFKHALPCLWCRRDASVAMKFNRDERGALRRFYCCAACRDAHAVVQAVTEDRDAPR